MPKSHDAMGQLLWDHFHGQDVIEIVEREDGYIDAGRMGPSLYFAKYKNWMDCEKKAIKYARGRVLDIGCGGGRVGLYLQGKGHKVVGIDNSQLAVDVCKLQGLKQVRRLPITQVDSRLGTFDTIVMYGNNFGLMGNLKRARWLLKRFHKLTSEQGRIIAQSLNPYQTDLEVHKQYHRLNKRRGHMGGQIKLRIRHHTIIGNWFDYLLVSKKEMMAILDGTGWYVNKFILSSGPFYMAIIDKADNI